MFRVALRLHGLICTVRLRTVCMRCGVYRVRYCALYILRLSCTGLVNIPSRHLLMVADMLLFCWFRLRVCLPAALLADVVPGLGPLGEPGGYLWIAPGNNQQHVYYGSAEYTA